MGIFSTKIGNHNEEGGKLQESRTIPSILNSKDLYEEAVRPVELKEDLNNPEVQNILKDVVGHYVVNFTPDLRAKTTKEDLYEYLVNEWEVPDEDERNEIVDAAFAKIQETRSLEEGCQSKRKRK